MRRLSKKKKREIKSKLWQTAKDLVKNNYIFVFIIFILAELLYGIFGDKK